MKIFMNQAHSVETFLFLPANSVHVYHAFRAYSHFPPLHLKSRDINIITRICWGWKEKQVYKKNTSCTCWTFRKRYTQTLHPIKSSDDTFCVSYFSSDIYSMTREVVREGDDNENSQMSWILGCLIIHITSLAILCEKETR